MSRLACGDSDGSSGHLAGKEEVVPDRQEI